MGMEIVFDANNLIKAFYKTSQETEWKESVQTYDLNLLQNIHDTIKDWEDGHFRLGTTHNFPIHERGHARLIKSNHIRDRVVLVSFVDNVLIPKMRPLLVYDNGASLKGKGIDFSRRRFCVHLNRFYKRHGNHGYIRFFNFSKYFDNIRHDITLEMLSEILEPDELAFIRMVFATFATDLSELSEEEFRRLDDGIFNSLDYVHLKQPGERKQILHKGIGIGSPVSQAVGTFFPYKLDNYIKTVLGVKEYGRYMDDFYIMAETVEQLDEWTVKIKEQCAKYRLFLSEKKIRTCRMDSEFVYLKTIYRVMDNGRILKRIHNSAVVRERKRFKKHKRLIEQGRMILKDAQLCYRGWRGCYQKLDSKKEIHKLDIYFKDVFEVEWYDIISVQRGKTNKTQKKKKIKGGPIYA